MRVYAAQFLAAAGLMLGWPNAPSPQTGRISSTRAGGGGDAIGSNFARMRRNV
jgi:hypothetical protein